MTAAERLVPVATPGEGGDASDGTEQGERAQPALAPGYARVDDRPLEALLGLLAGVASNLAWVDGANRRAAGEGWEDLYLRSDLGVLADMTAVDLRGLRRRAAELGRIGDPLLHAGAILEMAERIDGWFRVLRRSEHPAALGVAASLRRIIESDLGPALRPGLSVPGSPELTGRAPGGFAEVWGVTEERRSVGKALLPDPDPAALRRAHETLLNAFTYLSEVGRRGLGDLLVSGRNDPSLGLAVAFLQLFIEARRELNEFPRRRLEFYYRDVLQMRARGPAPDRALLLLRPAPGTPWLELPAGTEFSAGRDEDQQELVYATGEAVSVTDARIVGLRVLHYEQDPLISPERELGFVTRILGASAGDPAPGLERGAATGVFGGDGPGEALSPAGVWTGFAVASPVLALAGGTRRLTFDIALGDPPGEAGLSLEGAIAALDGVAPGDARGFFRHFGRIVCRALLLAPRGAPAVPEGSWCTPAGAEAIRTRAREVLRTELDDLLGTMGPQLSEEQVRAIRRVSDAGGAGEGRAGDAPDGALGRFPDPPPGGEPGHERRLDGILAGGKAPLSREQEERLRATVGELRASLEVVDRALTSDPLSLLNRLLSDALVVRFTGARGWEEVEGVHIGPGEDGGLRVEMTLGPQVGPVVGLDPALHGTTFDGTDPVVSFRVNPGATVFPYSFLHCLPLVRIEVTAEVRGVTDLVLHNALGPLDPSRPLYPFGPLPGRDSYLVVGSFEAAGKTLVEASLEIEWGGLPDLPGGLRQHYFAYDQDITNEAFLARVALLRDGRWEPLDPELASVAPLFRSLDDSGATAPTVRIPLGPMALFRPLEPGTPRERFASMLHARQGLFRLSLAPSEVTFGHREYPRLLTEALTRNLRRRKQEPLPNPPYTPLVNRITLDYTARATLLPGGVEAEGDVRAGSARDRILHEHPFGMEDLTASVDGQIHSLVPGRPVVPDPEARPGAREGYLFIGVQASELPGLLSLLFHLRHDALQDPVVEDPGAAWFYLRSNRWIPLESSRVLGDTTSGFQQSGIVTLDIPGDIEAGSTLLPRGACWLAVGVNRRIRSLVDRLLVVSAGGVEVTWKDRGNRREPTKGLPAGSIVGPRVRVPGLASVRQVGESFGGRSAETEEDLVTRTAERLRHRKRAVSAWDYERLVLDRFPEVFQVKVHPNTDTRYDLPRPGSVLVTVVPRLGGDENDQALTPRFSGGDLVRIRDYLRSLSPGASRIYVQNPVYEEIQVRCTVRLARGARPGQGLRELNALLVDHLSPWRPGGQGARFGWRIRRKDVEALIRTVPWVEAVTGFSMLQISVDPRGRYRLDDTARPPEAPRPPAAATPTQAPELSARYPWSLAVPTRHHALRTTPWDAEIEAEPTGVGSLEVGTNFILEAGRRNG